MTQREAVTIITEQQAVECLLAHGWTRDTCGACDGKGHYVSGDPDDWCKTMCEACAGAGKIWNRPTALPT